jgi:hypothetical protein
LNSLPIGVFFNRRLRLPVHLETGAKGLPLALKIAGSAT